MDSDFQSLSRGVFVVPFNPGSQADAGPSRSRSLTRYYDAALGRYQKAYDEHEQHRVTDQIQDVTDWLHRCANPPWMPIRGGTHRVPLGIMQNAAPALEARLDASLIARHVVTLNGRDIGDVSGGMRAIGLGLVSHNIAHSRSGKGGLDMLEEWYAELRDSDRGTILLQIASAQLVPLDVMSELVYVLALHPNLPIHVLLSVPSTAVFLDTLSFVEPSSVDMSILGAGKSRSSGAVAAILRADDGVPDGLRLSAALREKLYEDEAMFGAGPMAALKAIKWSLLHHQNTSPLAALTASIPDRAEAVLEGNVRGAEELLIVDVSEDMVSTLNPAPRISMLHALSHPTAFTDPIASRAAALPASAYTTPTRKRVKHVIDAVDLSGTTPKSAKRRRTGAMSLGSPDVTLSGSAPAIAQIPEPTGIMAQRGDLQELQTMFNLYRAAGRNINLWDWLEGFRAGMLPGRNPGSGVDGGDEPTGGADAAADPEGAPVGRMDEVDEDTAARLHAAFVRFCEEARMMGLMRAKGNARRKGVDEVVKSIGLL